MAPIKLQCKHQLEPENLYFKIQNILVSSYYKIIVPKLCYTVVLLWLVLGGVMTKERSQLKLFYASTSNKICKLQKLVYSGNYEIICIYETWLNETVLDFELLSSFIVFRKDRKGEMGGGVLIAVKEELQVTRRCDLERDGAEFVVVQFNKVNTSTVILYTYIIAHLILVRTVLNY